ncbi:RimK family alpha-L-glutamate ligase [Rhodopirellula sp. MGV]|uniref:ATP-grasp domain-containing protein n=1 Tax=Rhodopirellula sp. MGV TaxID=2023130 RepID=UPI000B961B2B|nr:RimK family alpha-L-glutamate ligase [Rhodopirellula sp. MGV]OYP32302.1 hypothetical protein CGZ80_19745 [Rhodopirellula sp. MGV]PNY35913.1 RimK family alpha-L-glutamate ligase [Rhodopirellula baltica]
MTDSAQAAHRMVAVKSARFLMLGPESGWHVNQLRAACDRHGCDFQSATYESLRSSIDRQTYNHCSAGRIDTFDGILTRTMPAASMELLTYRLAVLHGIVDGECGQQVAMINPPRGLEWAIDKFATTMRLAAAGFPVPETRVVQNRQDALEAFAELGGDCIVKPVFGGEGRGVMRVRDRELAWTCFSTLEQLNAIIIVQRFIPPGGRDTRLLVIGERVLSFRRSNDQSFRTNVASGAKCEAIETDSLLASQAVEIARKLGLHFASVDIIDNVAGPPLFLEVNAIPGWKGAQSVCGENIAELIVECLRHLSSQTR